MKKRIERIFRSGDVIDADIFNEMICAINELHLKIDYLFYQKTDPKMAAQIMAEILGAKDND